MFQYEQCIATASIKSRVFKVQCEPSKMVKEYQIRGSQESIFFVEKHLNRSAIMKLEFHAKSHKKLLKTEVYETNCRLVAVESDNDLSSGRHSFFILDEDQNVHQIEKCDKH